MKPIKAFAHRGGASEIHENSDVAFAYAADLGYRFFETDVRLTADGEVMISHDADLSRVWGDSRKIAECRWKNIAALRSGTARPILLRQVLADYPQLHLNIDAKEPQVAIPLIRAVRDAGAESRVVLASFHAGTLQHIRRVAPEIPTSLSAPEVARHAARTLILRRPTTHPANVVALQIPVSYGPLRLDTPDFLALAHSSGLEVHYWTIDDPGQMRRLLRLGADGIMTDRPSVLRGVMLEEGCWSEQPKNDL